MNKEKDEQGQDIVYALADYKQLVLSYKSKYMNLVKKVALWQSLTLGIGISAVCICAVVFFWLSDTKKDLVESKDTIINLSSKLEAVSEKINKVQNDLDRAQKELAASKEDLNKKEILIKKLKYNLSSTSKKFLENLLKEQETSK